MKKNSNNPQARVILFAAFIGIIGAAGGVSFWHLLQGPPQADDTAMLTLPEPRVIADFALLDEEGQPFALEKLRNHWSLLFFGFTHCPDVCPSALYDLGQVEEKLTESHPEQAEALQVIFVSLDPDRDSPEKLKQYVNYFDSGFTGVTGPQAQLKPLTVQLGVAYRIEAHEPGSQQYNVDHSASILLMNPEAQLHGVFPTPHDPGRMAAELAGVMGG
jgi:protein SCO1/2